MARVAGSRGNRAESSQPLAGHSRSGSRNVEPAGELFRRNPPGSRGNFRRTQPDVPGAHPAPAPLRFGAHRRRGTRRRSLLEPGPANSSFAISEPAWAKGLPSQENTGRSGPTPAPMRRSAGGLPSPTARWRLRRTKVSYGFLGVLIFAGGCSGTATPLTSQPHDTSTSSSRVEATEQPPPLIGTNYSHYRVQNCSIQETGILLSYHEPGVREIVREQLADMRQGGVETLRLILWHMDDIGTNRWGVVPSAGGKINEPYRTNLIDFLEDVREARYLRLTVALAPMGHNMPEDPRNSDALLEQNWLVIADTRELVKAHGPPDTHIDLMNEGAPAESMSDEAFQRRHDYLVTVYDRYVDSYGRDDVTISAIRPDRLRNDTTGRRLENLIDLMEASGERPPAFFEIHIEYSNEGALYGLELADEILDEREFDQPLIIGETAYNDSDVAAAIETFQESGPDRVILEVIQWPKRAESDCKDISEGPPYRVDEYLKALRS